jgi:DNA polymerase
MFGVPVVKHGINSELRQKGKIASLACGYQGSAGALISMGALEMGLKESELPEIIESWREANPHIVQFWWDVERAAIETVQDHQERSVNRIGFQFYANVLWLVLPSGRRLAYINPKLQPNRFGRMALTFEGLNVANKWSREETYGGKLVENLCQATARDILTEAMVRLENAGYHIVGHVHDEVILEVPKGSTSVEVITGIMSQTPSWAPDLCLAAAGYYGPDFYFKD